MTKKFLFLLVGLPLTLWAEDYVQIERFYYFLDAQQQTARVAQPLGVCQGDAVAVPTVVSHEGKEYRVKGIASKAFKGCKMHSLTLPASLLHVEEEAFMDCAHLSVMRLPGQLETIGKSAFQNCALLKALDLPASLRELGAAAFHGCPKIAEIRVERAEPLVLSEDALPFGRSQYAHTKLIVPAGAVEAYKAAPVWRKFDNIRDEKTTGLSEQDVDTTPSDKTYDLKGLPVAKGKVLPQGIYIVNGKKVQQP